jgi:hypothetical protein
MSGQFRIEIKKGPNTGQVLELTKDEITLGRAKSNDIYINDDRVDYVHSYSRPRLFIRKH